MTAPDLAHAEAYGALLDGLVAMRKHIVQTVAPYDRLAATSVRERAELRQYLADKMLFGFYSDESLMVLDIVAEVLVSNDDQEAA
jgi:hypothetical protein